MRVGHPLRQLKALIGIGRFGRSVAVLAGGTVAGQIAVILGSPILARLYSPKEMGLFGVYISFISVGYVVVCLKYESAIVSGRTPEESSHLVCIAVAFILPVTAILAGCLYGLIRASLLGFGDLPLYTVLIAVPNLVLIGGVLVGRYWLIRTERYRVVAHTTFLQQSGRMVGQIIFGAIGFGPAGLMAGELLGRTMGAGRVARAALLDLKPYIARATMRELRQTARNYMEFPLISTPSSLLDSVALVLPVPLVSQFYGSTSAGFLVLVQGVLTLPLGLVGAAVGDAFHGRFARLARESPGSMAPLFRRISLTLVAGGLLPTLVLVGAGPQLFSIVFGPKWATAGRFAAALAPWYWGLLVVSPVSRLVFVLKGQRLKLSYDVIAVLTVVGVMVASDRYSLTVLISMRLLGALGLVTVILYYGALARIVWLASLRPPFLVDETTQ